MDSIARSFLEKLREGKICVHPTDTVAGFTVDPARPRALASLVRLKGRESREKPFRDKPFLGLIARRELAWKLWSPLPSCWDRALQKLWPGPLSVIWSVRQAADIPGRDVMVSRAQTIGLRLPAWPTNSWFAEVLQSMSYPLPTTSVNRPGEPPLTEYRSLKELASEIHAYIPDSVPTGYGKPSTIIKIEPDGQYIVLREGAVDRAKIERSLKTS